MIDHTNFWRKKRTMEFAESFKAEVFFKSKKNHFYF